MNSRKMISAARVMSEIFNPFYLPVVAVIALFTFSYLCLLPLLYKLTVLAIVYILTAVVPTVLIRMYQKHEKWTAVELYDRQKRVIPYVISIACYVACYYLMGLLRIPHFMGSLVVAALVIQIVCAVVNIGWKISTHTAAIGGMVGAVAAFGGIIGFNPVWWLCGIILLGGLVGTSRMLLRQHSLGQVAGGFAVGAVSAFVTVIAI